MLHKNGIEVTVQDQVCCALPMMAKGKIEQVLRVPQDMDAIAVIPVGYPAESPEPKDRKPMAEVCDVIR